MTALAGAAGAVQGEEARLAEVLVRWLEEGTRPDGLFADDVLLDLTLPQWRLQAGSADAAFLVRESDHPFRGEVVVRGLDRTTRGFLIELEERWSADGQRWYCRELMHAVVTGARVSELVVYCGGDWDEAAQRRHARDVQLLRP